MQHNQKQYRGRSHTKKQRNNCKQKITSEERKKRKQLKLFAKLFPQWKHFLPCYDNSKNNLLTKISPLLQERGRG